MRSPLGSLFNKAPVPYVSSRGGFAGLGVRRAGAEAQMRAMGGSSTLFSIVNRTSNATAQVDWKLWRAAKSGKDEDRVEVTAHAALDLWNKPNKFYTTQELVETFSQHVDLTGEGWLVIARSPRSSIPLELWPVRPDRMVPVPHPEEFLSGYMYTGPSGEQIALRIEDVIQLRMPNPEDPYRGMGPVQTILTELDASRYSAEWNRNFFRNSAEPGGIIQVDKRLSDDEFDELSTRWNEQHKGVANAHRVAIIEQGTWVDRKLSQRDMQFAELRSVSRDVIREAFGIPKFAVGDIDDVNRATADASKAWFAEMLTVPRLERIKQALNNDLLPLFGATAKGLEFDYADPVPPNAEARNAELTAKANAVAALVHEGFEPAGTLSAVGLPEIPYVGAATSPPPPAPSAPAAPAARLDIHHHAAAAATAAGAPLAFGPPRIVAQDDTDDALALVRQDFEDALAALLDDWAGVEDAWIDALAAQVEAAVDDADLAALAALTVDSDDAAALLKQALADMATTAANRMVAEAAEQGVTVEPPEVDAGLTNALRIGPFRNYGPELVDIATATALFIASGLAASAGAEALRRYTPGAIGSSIAQAVTETLRSLKGRFRRDQLGGSLHRATNVGRLAVLEVAPAARYFADERMDSNTCPPCREIDGAEFDDLAAAQAVYGAGGYPSCEGGIRCRGTYRAEWDATGGGG